MMKLLCEIDDYILGLKDKHDDLSEGYREREAARAIIFNPDGKIALLQVKKHGYHKLPGGGIEPGENFHKALLREAREETGCKVAVREKDIGKIVEWRNFPDGKLKQISYCGVADVIEQGSPAFTPEELENGFELHWVKLDSAIHRLRLDSTDDYEGKFILFRDLSFLEKARAMGVKPLEE